VLAAIKQQEVSLHNSPRVSEELKADKKVVLAAVTPAGDALWHASDALKIYREVVLAAVSQNWRELKYAADWLASPRAGLTYRASPLLSPGPFHEAHGALRLSAIAAAAFSATAVHGLSSCARLGAVVLVEWLEKCLP